MDMFLVSAAYAENAELWRLFAAGLSTLLFLGLLWLYRFLRTPPDELVFSTQRQWFRWWKLRATLYASVVFAAGLMLPTPQSLHQFSGVRVENIAFEILDPSYEDLPCSGAIVEAPGFGPQPLCIGITVQELGSFRRGDTVILSGERSYFGLAYGTHRLTRRDPAA